MRSIFAQLVEGAALPLTQTEFKLVDGQSIWGGMNTAEPGKVATYLDETTLRHPPKDVTFSASVLEAPVLLHATMQLTHVASGFRYRVQHIDDPYLADGASYVQVLIVTV